ncbi:hypothetical protein [Streptomyces sp. NPDC088719]|uniref:hypothetical protein n=1 Tax=Streptomyces sp. NPDC088719 TaxID=3365872 RepID=UPI003802E156
MPGADEAGGALFSLPMVVPRATEYVRLGVSPEATADEIRAASNRNDARLRARGARDEEIAAGHAANLESTESRAAHDARQPPLPLLRLAPTWEPILDADAKAAGLTVLRRETEAFLSAAGADVHHPTDTTRTDFTGDFTRTHLLDGLADD